MGNSRTILEEGTDVDNNELGSLPIAKLAPLIRTHGAQALTPTRAVEIGLMAGGYRHGACMTRVSSVAESAAAPIAASMAEARARPEAGVEPPVGAAPA
jgi:hypothetical protein